MEIKVSMATCWHEIAKGIDTFNIHLQKIGRPEAFQGSSHTKIRPLDKIVFWRKNTMQVWEQECSICIKARLHKTWETLMVYCSIICICLCLYVNGMKESKNRLHTTNFLHPCLIIRQIQSILRFICTCEQPPWFTASNVNEPRIPSSSPENIKR